MIGFEGISLKTNKRIKAIFISSSKPIDRKRSVVGENTKLCTNYRKTVSNGKYKETKNVMIIKLS